MIDEVSDTLSQLRTHTMKGLKGEVSLGKKLEAKLQADLFHGRKRLPLLRFESEASSPVATFYYPWCRSNFQATEDQGNFLHRRGERLYNSVPASSTASPPCMSSALVLAMA